MMMKEVFACAAILVALLAAGCVSSPEKAVVPVPVKDKYVELRLIDESKVGGKYVSESAAYTTIIPMYTISKSGEMREGNGKETGIASKYITAMITIEDPRISINETIAKQDAAMKAYKEKQAEQDAALALENDKKLGRK